MIVKHFQIAEFVVKNFSWCVSEGERKWRKRRGWYTIFKFPEYVMRPERYSIFEWCVRYIIFLQRESESYFQTLFVKAPKWGVLLYWYRVVVLFMKMLRLICEITMENCLAMKKCWGKRKGRKIDFFSFFFYSTYSFFSFFFFVLSLTSFWCSRHFFLLKKTFLWYGRIYFCVVLYLVHSFFLFYISVHSHSFEY